MDETTQPPPTPGEHRVWVPPIWEPPMTGDEAQHLLAMLDRLRTTFRYKTEGLSLEQLTQRLAPGRLSLGGLLQHLAVVEDEKFTWMIARQRPELLLKFTAPGVDQFEVNETGPAPVYERYDAAVARSRQIQEPLLRPGALDEPSALEFEGQHPSIRRIVCDLIEEYGRHTGHADLLREAVDGRVGEDPPGDYLPTWYPTD